MLYLIAVLTACAPPQSLEGPEVTYPCADGDSPIEVEDSDAAHVGFSALEAVDFLDGFELKASYTLDESADQSLSEEIIALSVERTSRPVEYVDRASTPPGVMGQFLNGECLLGPLLRVPVLLRWPTRTLDGSVGWWEAERVIEVGSVDDPNLIEVFVNIDYYSFDSIEPVLREYLASFVDGKELSGAYLTAWGTLGVGDRLAIEVLTEADGDEGGFTSTEPTLRTGDWVAGTEG